MPSNPYLSSQLLVIAAEWRSVCNSRRSMRPSYKYSHLPSQRRDGRSGREIAGGAGAPTWTVNIESSLAADTQRIFHALTVPEYIEAWICVPGYHPECRNISCRFAHGFQIEHRCNSGVSTSITGTYCSFLKRKLSFTWRSAGVPDAHYSFVDIRLHGDFERSILRLRHFGLPSEDEFNWHSALWSASLARLRRLFDRPATGAEYRRPRTRRRQAEIYCER
jgi:uncharacterized protein YndB with AHSA1/START domain